MYWLFTELAEKCCPLRYPVVLWLLRGKFNSYHKVSRVAYEKHYFYYWLRLSWLQDTIQLWRGYYVCTNNGLSSLVSRLSRLTCLPGNNIIMGANMQQFSSSYYTGLVTPNTCTIILLNTHMQWYKAQGPRCNILTSGGQHSSTSSSFIKWRFIFSWIRGIVTSRFHVHHRQWLCVYV